MRVMLTGATGFIGYHTARSLLEAGHEVSLLVRSPDKMEKVFGAGVIQHFTQGDITDAGPAPRPPSRERPHPGFQRGARRPETASP